MKQFFKSLFTDGEWDGDVVKVFGVILIICGIVGFFLAIPEWQWIIGFGSTLVATGKFSIKG
jgi:FtsH-binding integral membrane protein